MEFNDFTPIELYNENRDLKRVNNKLTKQLMVTVAILIKLRDMARKDNNYDFSDFVRDELKKVDVILEDKKK